MDQLYNLSKFCDKFDFDRGRAHATAALRSMLRKDPFAGLAYASRTNNLALGKQAIELLELAAFLTGQFDLWEVMSEVKPSWQIALANYFRLSIFGTIRIRGRRTSPSTM